MPVCEVVFETIENGRGRERGFGRLCDWLGDTDVERVAASEVGSERCSLDDGRDEEDALCGECGAEKWGVGGWRGFTCEVDTPSVPSSVETETRYELLADNLSTCGTRDALLL